MNIFVLDLNPEVAATYHNNKHVVKMILESKTLLELAHNPNKNNWKHHPCSKWARSSRENYRWLAKLAVALCQEYTYRYSKKHKCQDEIIWLRDNEPTFQVFSLTNFVQAMPEDVKSVDPVKAYRDYYIKYKRHLAKWKTREVPSWYE